MTLYFALKRAVGGGLALAALVAGLGAAPLLPTVMNAGPILIPDHGAASPSPSSILVSGVPSGFRKVAVTLTGLTHTFAFDLEVLLVGPNGHGVVLMSATGGGAGMTNVSVSFDDEAGQALPGLPNGAAIGSGSYRPTDLFGVEDYFGSNAPAGPYGLALSDFTGGDPNGRWSLYVYDSSEADSGIIAGGWSLTFWDGNGKLVEPLDPSALDRWHVGDGAFQDSPMAVTAHPGGFVAVGGTNIYSSSDGYTWTRRTSVVNGALLGLGAGNGTVVAVGSGGAILTSPDGSNWVRRSANADLSLRDVTFGSGRFVAVGDSGAAVVSVDAGATWQRASAGTNQGLLGVAYGEGVFIAVGTGGSIRVSADGFQWLALPPLTNQTLASVTYGDGQFVTISSDVLAVWLSQDGTNWLRQTVPAGAGLSDVIHAGGQFVSGGSQGALLSSVDGTNWLTRSFASGPSAARIQGLAFDGEMWVAVTSGASNRFLTSDPVRLRAPRIVRPPQDAVVRAGGATSVSFTAAGTSPMTCQWQKDGVPLAGATNQTLGLSGFRLEMEGGYAVRVANAIGVCTSAVARVSLGLPPVIVAQPLDRGVVPGGEVILSVAVTGTPPFSYHWQPPSLLQTTLTSAERQSFWIVTNVQASGAGTYSVQVSNDYGSELSRGARVSLVADVNADGLPDQLELASGLELGGAANVKLDRDGDGVSDLDELRAGTNPTNAASVLRLRVGLAGGQVSLEFAAETNQTYTVQSATALAPGQWSRWVDFVATTNRRIETIAGATGSSNRFFRVVTPRQP